MNIALTGHTALIIGANGGIGTAIARSLGAAGARLILAARDEPRLQQLHAELNDTGIESKVIPVDITDDEAVCDLVERAAAEGMDIAVNNAGTAHQPAPLGELPLAVSRVRSSQHGPYRGRSGRCDARTHRCRASPGSSACHGARCGGTSGRSWSAAQRTSPASPVSPPWVWMSTCGITSPPNRRSRAGAARRS